MLNFHHAKRQHGLSLIELMISITLGLIILSALASLFISQSKARTELDKSNRMIDNGRYALEVLSGSLELAGFYAGFDTSALPLPTVAQSDPCSTTVANISAALPLHVQGYNAATALVAATIPAGGACIPATRKTGSDILVVRRVSTAAAIAQAAAVAGTIYLQTRGCQYDALDHILDNTPANFTLHQMNCPFGVLPSDPPYTTLRPVMVQIYYIDSNNQASDGIPTLKRLDLDATGAFVSTPLVEGIEFMQVEYGRDTTAAPGDGSADDYLAAPALADWPNIMSVKLHIIARNIEPTKGYTDTKTYALGPGVTAGPFNAAPYNTAPYPTVYPKLENYKRHAYTQVVHLVNPSGRRSPP